MKLRNLLARLLLGNDVAELLRGYKPPQGKHNSLITGSPTSWTWGKGDHGEELDGLGDDDHTQYLNNARHGVVARHPLSVLDPAVCSETEADNKIAADTEVTEGAFDGTNIKNSNDTGRSTTSTSYVKKKEVKLNENLDKSCRIKFAIQSGVTGKTVYGRIYKNGIALGSEQSWNINEYTIKSQDFAANEFQTNDLVQIYVKISADAVEIDIKDMRFYYDTLDTITGIGTHELVNPLHIKKPSISMTNQDPL